jgi:hypothetical protein
MKRKYLGIGISIIAVILLTLTSLSNVVGYQTVQTSQQNLIKERINQRELAFQTICDIANNKEIQRIILKSQMSRGIFPTSDIPVLTKNQLKMMYLIGVLLSRFISKTKMQSMIGKYQFDNQEMQKEINAVIEKDTTLKGEIIQLKTSECDCESNKTAETFPPNPILCAIVTTIALCIAFMFFIDIFLLDTMKIEILKSLLELLSFILILPYFYLWSALIFANWLFCGI